MKTPFAALVLAAGQGKRMKSSLAKVLHPLAGRPLLAYPLLQARAAGAKRVVVVAPPKQKEIHDFIAQAGADLVVQHEAKGTGHAVLVAKSALRQFKGYVFLLCGDVPLITAKTLQAFAQEVLAKKAKLGLVSFLAEGSHSYGRVVRNTSGSVCEIVEAKNASAEQLRIREVNSGVYCADASWLFAELAHVKPNALTKEYYLTDIVQRAAQAGEEVVVHLAQDANEFLGVNSQQDLEHVSQLMRRRINQAHMNNGVCMLDAATTYIDADVRLSADVVLHPNVHLLGKTQVGTGSVVETGSVLRDATLHKNVVVHALSVVESSVLRDEVSVGPFARVRPQSDLGRKVKIGNFVEVKKSQLAEGVKASHLSYLGDATIGKNTNIGCGTITCNYDGRHKHQTTIGENVFVGSDTQFVAPVKIGAHATIGAGSTITKDVPAKALALSRVAQVVVPGWKPKVKKKK